MQCTHVLCPNSSLLSFQYCSCLNGRVRLETSSVEIVARYFIDIVTVHCSSSTFPINYQKCFPRALLNDTDTFLLPLGICQPLKLKEVQEATLLSQTEGQEYSVLELQFTVEPFSALFHATISMNTSPPSLPTVTLIRMDWYSVTSSCVPSDYPNLRPLCICY